MDSRRRVMVLVAMAAVALAGLGLWASVPAQAEPAGVDLALIGEETGLVAAHTPLSPDCFFDAGYEVYLCEPPGRVTRMALDPAARAEASALLNAGGLLMIPDSANKRIMAFDPTSGDLVDPNWILLDEEATGTVIHAILGPGNQILVSDQTRDVVHGYDLAGNYLGVFAPAGGADPSIIDNIRGIALRPNGHLLVSVGAGANADAIAEFDTDGNYVGNFVANGSGGLASPFDVYQRVGTDWLVSSINSNQVLRYDLDTGAPLGELAPIDSFPQQILEIPNGNVLVGNFSGTQTGVVELTADGTLVGVHTAPGLSSFRGVYELPNGNLLASTSGGVFEIDRNGNLIDTKYEGQSRFIERVVLASIDLQKTVGLDPAVCAETDEIALPAGGGVVTYCFSVENTGGLTLSFHDLVDSELGIILDGLAFSLMPGASVFVTQTVLIDVTTVNTATWAAYNAGYADLATAMDSATVYVGFQVYLPVVLRQ